MAACFQLWSAASRSAAACSSRRTSSCSTAGACARWKSSHNLTITGNLFVDGGGVPVVSTIGTYQVNVNYTVPVQAQGISTSGSTGPSAADIAEAVRVMLVANPGVVADPVWAKELP